MFVLDTNVISEIRKPSADPRVLAWMRERRPSELYLAAITIYEIEVGVRRIERRDQRQGERLRRWMVQGVLDQFRGRVLALDDAVAVRAAALQVPDPRPERDCFLAATALVHGMSVVSRNVADFAPTGVPVVNPWGRLTSRRARGTGHWAPGDAHAVGRVGYVGAPPATTLPGES